MGEHMFVLGRGPVKWNDAILEAMRIFRLPLIAACAWVIAGCGGMEREVPSVPGGADPEAVAVIEGWVTSLARGDVEEAASYFAIPSVAENGPVPFEIESAEDAIAFNRALPCGAELIEAETAGRFTTATFELIERPGGDCGIGVGSEAATAFVIENGKIVEWRRLPNPGGGPGPAAPVV